ncbi:MAG: nitroreductase family protein [Syntrophales bacterium]
MLTTKEAIEKRRSIRKFKPDTISEEHITALLDAARLAPSGSNSQPWRFKVVRDREIRLQLAQASYKQAFIAEAPIVFVCCIDLKSFIDGTVSGIQDLGRIGAVEGRIVKIIADRTERYTPVDIEELTPRIALNLAIAVEHIVLRALDFGLGSCWVRLFDEKAIKSTFGWGRNIHVVALLPVGYPAETPAPRRRLKIEEILID